MRMCMHVHPARAFSTHRPTWRLDPWPAWNESARLITRETESSEDADGNYRGSKRKGRVWAENDESKVERRWRETSNPNKGNSESDKSSGDLQPPGAFSVTGHEYNHHGIFFFFIPSSLLGFFLSREREKDVHVLEHQSVRHSCGTTRGRIQREAGKKTESILLSDAGIISFHFERVNEHLYPRVRGFTPRENGKESSILIYDHDFSPPPLSSSRTSSPHN